MPLNPRRAIPIVLVLAAAAFAVYWFYWRPASADDGPLTASGTIETVEVIVSPELGGRIVSVAVEAGDRVAAGQALVQLDPALLMSQRAQAEAMLRASEAAALAARRGAEAAAANLKLLEAGPSPEQLAVAQTVVDNARLAADTLQASYDDLSAAARETASGQQLKQQLDAARATLDNAQAQFDLVAAGARPEQLAAALAQAQAATAQADAAQAQSDAARAAVAVLQAQIARLTVVAPTDGVVLVRAVEPGELAAPGSTLLVIGRLDRLTITVFAPEDRYGTIAIGQPARVTVDSFPGTNFRATVQQIADRAEFTPRNVQTAEGRRTTVFAIRLSIENPDGRLKPGMPADVAFGE